MGCRLSQDFFDVDVTQGSMFRRDKLNSQFIVTKFSILHAGGRSLFRFQTSVERLCWSARSPEPRPLIRALERVRPKRPKVLYIILDLKILGKI